MSSQPTDVTISCDSNLNFSSEFLLGAGSFFLGGGGTQLTRKCTKWCKILPQNHIMRHDIPTV